MTSSIAIALSYQGGGAKLASLVAVANAAFHEAPSLGLRIESVSGTSAGAIAAAITASGVDPDLFRKRLVDIGPKYIKKLTPWLVSWPMVGTPVSIIRALCGFPILRRHVLRRFLLELFNIDGKELRKIGDLVLPISIFAADLQTRRLVEYGSDPEQSLIDVLVNSASIPFFLHEYRSSEMVVDGGLVNNLPIRHLIEGRSKDAVIAVSFKDGPATPNDKKLKSYLDMLISTAIDSHVHIARSSIPENNIHLVMTNTQTLDFAGAIANDLSDQGFANHASRFAGFLSDYRDRIVSQSKVLTPAEIAQRVVEFHRALAGVGKYRVTKALYKWTCRCLRERTATVQDVCDVEFLIEVLEGPLFCVGLQYLSEGKFYNIGDISVSVTDTNTGELIDNTPIPLTPELLGGRNDDNNLIIFLHKPLIKGRRYRFDYQVLASEILYDTREGGSDSILYSVANIDLVDEVFLVAFVPDWMKDLQLVPFDDPERVTRQVKGRELDRNQLASVNGNPVGFRKIGWGAQRISKGQWTGFSAQYRLPDR